MKSIILILLFVCSTLCRAQTVEVSKDIQVAKLSDKAYLYTAWADMGSWGRVGSNGLIIVNKGDAFLVDTPVDEAETIQLVDWIESALKAKVVGFVPGHWHDDCVGGLDYLNKQSVKTYANKLTNQILKEKGEPQAKYSFTDSTTLTLNGLAIECHYLGGGHATDNIVVWLPSEKILFGGCMLKDCKTTGLGNTSDAAPLQEWLKTVCAVEAHFPQAKIVIPGHGQVGGMEVVKHTVDVLTENQK